MAHEHKNFIFLFLVFLLHTRPSPSMVPPLAHQPITSAKRNLYLDNSHASSSFSPLLHRSSCLPFSNGHSLPPSLTHSTRPTIGLSRSLSSPLCVMDQWRKPTEPSSDIPFSSPSPPPFCRLLCQPTCAPQTLCFLVLSYQTLTYYPPLFPRIRLALMNPVPESSFLTL